MQVLANSTHATDMTAAEVPTHPGLSPAGDPSTRAIATGTELYGEGEPSSHVFVVETGILRLCRVTIDGRRQVSGFVYPGHVLGLARGDTYLHTAEAVTPCRVRAISADQVVQRLTDDPQLARQLLSMATDDLLAAQDQIFLLGRKTAIERLATFLLDLSHRNAAAGRDATMVHVPMSRGDIADYLGLTIETVSRMFTRLKTAGYIRLHAGQQVELPDPEALASLADDEHSAILPQKAAV